VLISIVRISVAERHRQEVLRMLRIFRGRTTARAGCLEFHVSQDVVDANILTVTERWATREELNAHVRSADYKLLLAAIDLATAPPEIRFDATDHVGGLDVVRAARSGQPAETDGSEE
jgi:quinol monooxygenase YgiN